MAFLSDGKSKPPNEGKRKPVGAFVEPGVTGWLYALRFFSYLVVIGAYFITLNAPRELYTGAILYSALTLYIPVSALWPNLLAVGKLRRGIIAAQYAAELYLCAGVVALSGGSASPFSAIFALSIIAGALSYNLAGALTVAVGAAVCQATASLTTLAEKIDGEFVDRLVSALEQAPDVIWYAILLHALTYLLTAVVAGYFAERARRGDRQLAATSHELDRALLQTDEIIKRVSAGLLTLGTSGRITLFNTSAAGILGVAEADARGQDFRDVFKAGLSELAGELARVLDTGVARARMEVFIARADGYTAPLGITTAPILDSTGKSLGVIAIFQDITGAKALEEIVRRSDRLLAVAEMSAAIAHEIRNPLAAIVGSVEALGRTLTVTGAERDLIDLVMKESARLNRTLGDFLLYARVDRVERTKVELLHIIVETLEMARRHPSYHNSIRLEFHSVDSVMYVVGDEGQLKQIIFNLILNAIEALAERPPASPQVTITIVNLRDQGRALLSVQDNGPGIPNEHLTHIFEPFFSTKKGGSGLGLAIAHRLAEAMGVTLTVSSHPEQETVFYLDFRQYRDEVGRIVIDGNTGGRSHLREPASLSRSLSPTVE